MLCVLFTGLAFTECSTSLGNVDLRIRVSAKKIYHIERWLSSHIVLCSAMPLRSTAVEPQMPGQ